MYDYYYSLIWSSLHVLDTLIFISCALSWLAIGAVCHVLLQKKGYKHTGLYILAWLPLVNILVVFFYTGLPDVLLGNKLQYFYHLLANGGSGAASQPSQSQPLVPNSGNAPSSTNYNQPNPQVF